MKDQKDCSEFKISVLVVDDEPIVHTMMQKLIEKSGLPVQVSGTATSGAEAIELAVRLKPDICFLDINMDDMDGLEAARRLREILDYHVRIIYLTAYDRFDYARQAVRLGAMDFILKPARRDELINVFKRAINEIQAERLQAMEERSIRERLQSILPAAVPAAAKQSRASAVVNEVKEYVDRNYAKKISLTTAADHVCLSPGYLGPLFKSVAGVSFRSYLRSVRVSRAKELMKDHTLNLTQIAQAVGYDDQNYFSQVFLEETGIRPGEYRGGGRHWAR